MLKTTPTISPRDLRHYDRGTIIHYEKLKLKNWKYDLTRGYGVQTRIRCGRDIHTEYITLLANGMLYIHPSYWWNGANKPAINTKTNRLPSLIHDALLQLIREEYLPYRFREEADKEFHRWLLACGMHPIRAGWSYGAVRLYARAIRGSHYLRHGNKDEN